MFGVCQSTIWCSFEWTAPEATGKYKNNCNVDSGHSEMRVTTRVKFTPSILIAGRIELIYFQRLCAEDPSDVVTTLTPKSYKDWVYQDLLVLHDLCRFGVQLDLVKLNSQADISLLLHRVKLSFNKQGCRLKLWRPPSATGYLLCFQFSMKSNFTFHSFALVTIVCWVFSLLVFAIL